MPVANSIVVTQGVTTVNGYQTSFEGADGDLLVANGISAPILQVNSSTQLILKSGWPGTTTSDVTNWQIALTSPYWNDAVGAFSKINELLDRLQAGMPFEPDHVGPFSDRAQFNDATPPFIFLAMTPAPAKLYFKTGTGATDWSDPIQIQSSATGQDAVITGASASALPEGASPTVTLGGTPGARTFAFGIPTGPRGLPNTLTVGSVTAGLPAASITGTSPNQTLNLVLAQGPTGAPGPVSGDRFEDRAAAVLATAIDLSIQVIFTDCYDKSRSTRRGGSGYRRVPKSFIDTLWDSIRDGPAIIHAAGDVNVTGGSYWIIQGRGGGVDFDALGAVATSFNEYSVGATNNTAAMQAYTDLMLFEFYPEIKTLFVSPGWYAFSDTLIFKSSPVHILGQGTATEWQRTVFAFPFGKSGIFVHYGNTKGTTPLNQEYDPPGSPTNNGGGAGGSRFEGITIYGNTYNGTNNFDMRAIADGVTCRARALFRNVFIANFARHGLYIVTSIGAATDNPTGAGNSYAAGNANNTRFQNSTVQWCGGSGIRIAGADSNACSVMDSEANYCGFWGFEDSSFLGPNGLYNFHTTDNGFGVGSTPTHGYNGIGGKSGALVTYDNGSGVKTYVAGVPGDFTDLDAQWGRYCTTVPGTNEYVWETYHDGDGGFSKPWIPSQARGYYTHGGSIAAYGVNLKTAIHATYHESGQPPVQIKCTGASYSGSQTASNMTRGSYGFIDDAYEFRHTHPQVAYLTRGSTYVKTQHQGVGINEQGNPYVNRRASTEFGLELYDSIEGDNMVTRFHQSGTPASARLRAVAGLNSTGLGVDGSGQAPELGLNIDPRFALAKVYDGSWQIRRQVVLHNHEINDAKLGSYDIAWYSEPWNGTTSTDVEGMVKGGWAGRVILSGGAAGAAKTWASFGQIEDLRSLGPAAMSTLFSGAPSSLAAGASTGWMQWSGHTNISPTDELSITMSRGSDVGGNPTYTREAMWFGFGVVGVRVTNTGPDALNFGAEVRFILRVRK